MEKCLNRLGALWFKVRTTHYNNELPVLSGYLSQRKLLSYTIYGYQEPSIEQFVVRPLYPIENEVTAEEYGLIGARDILVVTNPRDEIVTFYEIGYIKNRLKKYFDIYETRRLR